MYNCTYIMQITLSPKIFSSAYLFHKSFETHSIAFNCSMIDPESNSINGSMQCLFDLMLQTVFMHIFDFTSINSCLRRISGSMRLLSSANENGIVCC